MKGFLKLFAIRILRILMRTLRVFPIKNNRIILNSYSGRQYSCNPKYITEYLLSNYKDTFEIIWAFNNPDQYKFLSDRGVKCIKYFSFLRLYYEVTAKISVNNIGSFSWLPIRKGQEHVNTWHSGLDLENCGINEPANDAITRKTIKLSADETSLFLSPNRVFSEYSVIEQFGYSGMILNAGLPRTDALSKSTSENLRFNTRSILRIEQDAVVLMYAPTWRYGGSEAMPEMNYVKLAESLQKRNLKTPFYILNRSHHLTKIKNVNTCTCVIDVSTFDDIEALVACCDVLISDYSSVLWDGAIANKTLIQYAPDAKNFEKVRGLYVPVGKWGIPACFSMDSLCALIENIDFNNPFCTLIDTLGNYETGRASEMVCKWIYDKCFDTEYHKKEYDYYICKVANNSNDTIIKKMNDSQFTIY